MNSSLVCNSSLPLQQIEKKPWQPRALPIDITIQKMWKNSEKAFTEHSKKDPLYYNALPSIEVLKANQLAVNPLVFEHGATEALGPKRTMEDVHMFETIEAGAIAGVFDGHGGKEVAEYASSAFKQKFPEALKKANGNVHQAFEAVISEIQEEVAKKESWNDMGTTALICFMDNKTHKIYTATLGDSEANIYRKIEGQYQSIPLSCVRDWGSKRDANRAAIARKEPSISEEWPKERNPKFLRFNGLNVSRSIGDLDRKYLNGKEGVSHKPKITVNLLKAGDVLTLACDGLKDFVSEQEIIEQVSNETAEALSSKIVRCALRRTRDNVTVIVIKVQEQMAKAPESKQETEAEQQAREAKEHAEIAATINEIMAKKAASTQIALTAIKS
jgi:serine/threonine protein phosphatase PrpC